ncbi:hypothetical protein GCM10007392_23420 [Saccharospirillum salsuginis]|uniref:HYR domain-containing protein n=2 Tax=Saccharospirillum salsuginis TaxID=418750 RepID=A0A918KB96_9GAMM|nr:hypothetical protein GCM10007392_23420 [Saccharospirillum salsuginis]
MVKASLTWTDIGASEYGVYRSSVGGGPYEPVGVTDSDYSTYLDKGLETGTRYYWVVTERDKQGQNLCQSNEATAATYDRATGNHVPQILTTGLPDATANQAYTAAIEAEDSNAEDTLTFRLIDAPDGLTIDANAGLLSWTPAEPGTSEFIVHVSDGRGAFDERRFHLTVDKADVPPADTTPPTLTAPADLEVEATAELTPVDLGEATATDDRDGALTPTADTIGPFALGDHTVTWSATDSAGNTGTDTQAITVQDTTPPSLTVPDNIITVSDEPVTVDLGQPTTSDLFEPVSLTNDAPDLFPVGETEVTWIATDANGNATIGIQVVIVEKPDPGGDLPPDPADVAPLLDNPSTSLLDATAFLYTSANPIQTGVAEGTIEERRAAVIRGRVLDRDNNPLPGVTVTIKGHDEFGQTLSRADGEFDLVVNGGGSLFINYDKPGYLPVQRKVETPWDDYVIADDIVMIPLDPEVTMVDLTSDAPLQAAQGSVQTDIDGSRQATVLFPRGTEATVTLPDGSTQALTNLNVRATEYTVGDNGPQAMPGELPPTSAYTYAVELSVDEALTLGASRVDFNQKLPFYVDNFLGFPTGEVVPVGWFDRESSAWIPAENGRVIEIIGIQNGQAVLDVYGEGNAATANELAELHVSEAELTYLAETYEVGKSLWRTPIDHFTPWDCNWPYGPPAGAEPPPGELPGDSTPDSKDCDKECGSVIEVQSGVLGESIPISGTPFTLNYRTNRAEGYQVNRRLIVPITGSEVPNVLAQATVTIRIAGQEHEWVFENLAPNQNHVFTWNGVDRYGRTLANAMAEVTVSYSYPLQYYASSASFETAFATVGDMTRIIGSRESSSIAMAKRWQKTLFSTSKADTEIGNWSLSPHHKLLPKVGALLYGSGSVDYGIADSKLIATKMAHSVFDISQYPEEGVYGSIMNIAAAENGDVYVGHNTMLSKVALDGSTTHIAGQPDASGSSGNGGAAVDALLSSDPAFDVAPDGSIYLADLENGVRKIDDSGIITQVESEPAKDIKVDEDTTIYYVTTDDKYNNTYNVIKRRLPSGLTVTVAGDGATHVSDGGISEGDLATDYTFPTIIDMDLMTDGSIVFVTKQSLWGTSWTEAYRVSLSGQLYRYSQQDPLFSGGEQFEVQAFAIDGGDNSYFKIKKKDNLGKYESSFIAGLFGNFLTYISGDKDKSEDVNQYQSRMISDFSMAGVFDMAISPDGSIYAANYKAYGAESVYRIHRSIGRNLSEEVTIPSDTGDEYYVFNQSGQHLRTHDGFTDQQLYAFAYNELGSIVSITDQFGQVTHIERDTDDRPTAIVSPYGQRTSLDLNSSGYLTFVSDPVGRTYNMVYKANGLLESFSKPGGQSNTFRFDDAGRLVKDTDPLLGGWLLNRSEWESGYKIGMTSGEGRVKEYAVDMELDGAQTSTLTLPSGSVKAKERHINGNRTIDYPNGTVLNIKNGFDPRFDSDVTYVKESDTITPAGLVMNIAESRTIESSVESDEAFSVFTREITINDRTIVQSYDRASNSWSTTKSSGITSSSQLNDIGLLSEYSLSGIAAINYHYDSRGRLDELNQGGTSGRTSVFGYDSWGYLNKMTDSRGRTVSYVNNEVGLVQQQTNPDGSVVEYDYDLNGNLNEIRLPSGDLHTFRYTAVDKQKQYLPPNPDDDATDAPIGNGHPTTQYQYNLDKQLEAVIRPDGMLIDYVYNDTTGQLTDILIPEGSYQYGYYGENDAFNSGQLETLTAPGGQQTGYQYDGFLLTDVTWSGSIVGTLGYEYNNYFEPVTQTVNGNGLTLSYNQDGQLTGAGDLSIDYVAENGLLDGTTLGGLTTDRTYNNFGELANYTASNSAGSLYQYTLHRDEVGRIVGKTETLGGNTTEYEYNFDQNDRLVSVTENGAAIQTWDYDANGNRTHEGGASVATYDAQNRLIRYKENEYRYTANGELTEKIDTATNKSTQFDYDAFSNLRSVTLPDGTNIEYVIDGQNRRVGKLRNGTMEQGFLYQGQLNPVAELDQNNQIKARFVYGHKRNVPAYMIKDGIDFRIISDHLGSVRLVINASTGEIAQRMDYDAWGNVITDTNPGFQPFGYAGGIYDRDTGLTRFGARDYDPEIGRWTTKDPIDFEGGLNNYSYVSNDPINYIDPEGKFLFVPLISAGVGAVIHGYTMYQNGGSLGEVVGAAAMGAATNIVPGGVLLKGSMSAYGNMISQAYDPCFGGLEDMDWSQAAAAGALGAAGFRPFQPTTVAGSIANEAAGQVVDGAIAEQF